MLFFFFWLFWSLILTSTTEWYASEHIWGFFFLNYHFLLWLTRSSSWVLPQLLCYSVSSFFFFSYCSALEWIRARCFCPWICFEPTVPYFFSIAFSFVVIWWFYVLFRFFDYIKWVVFNVSLPSHHLMLFGACFFLFPVPCVLACDSTGWLWRENHKQPSFFPLTYPPWGYLQDSNVLFVN